MKYWLDQSTKDYERLCLSGSTQNENPDTQGLDLQNILPIIYMTLILQSITILVFLVEVLTYRLSKRIHLSQISTNRTLISMKTKNQPFFQYSSKINQKRDF